MFLVKVNHPICDYKVLSKVTTKVKELFEVRTFLNFLKQDTATKFFWKTIIRWEKKSLLVYVL